MEKKMKKSVQASHDTWIPPRGKQIKYINDGLNPTGSERGLTSQNLQNPPLWLEAATMRIIFPFRLSRAAVVSGSKGKLTTDGRNVFFFSIILERMGAFFPNSCSRGRPHPAPPHRQCQHLGCAAFRFGTSPSGALTAELLLNIYLTGDVLKKK